MSKLSDYIKDNRDTAYSVALQNTSVNEDFICNIKYNEEVFEKVMILKQCQNWFEIDKFMFREYSSDWTDIKMRQN